MPSKIIAPVHPPTLRRIRELVGYASPDDVDIKLPDITDVAKQIRRWEDGKDKIGLTEAKKLAAKYRVVFPLLYLKQLPPIFDQPLPKDFRRGKKGQGYSRNLIFAIREAMFYQNWLREYLEEVGHDRPVLSKQVSWKEKPERIAGEIREWLKVSSDPRENRAKTVTQTLEKWQRVIDERNIVILTNKNAKEYKISEEEYNGLAMADDIAPVILLNPDARISSTRRIFTLMHELAHLFLHESAVSIIDFQDDYANTQEEKKERWCNQLAGEILVPGKWLLRVWPPSLFPGTRMQVDVKMQIEKIAKDIHVSRDMLAVRAKNVGLIKQEELSNLLQTYKKEYDQLRAKLAKHADSSDTAKESPLKSKQPSFNAFSEHSPTKSSVSERHVKAALQRQGRYFSCCVLDAYQSGIISATDIYDLTGGLKLKYLKEFAKKLDYPLHKWK